jgi:O-antigen ligase
MKKPVDSGTDLKERLLWSGMGLLLFLLPLRFGNPENPNFAPTPYGNPVIAFLGPWPVEWVYTLLYALGILLLLGLGFPKKTSRWSINLADGVLLIWLAIPLLTGWLATEYGYVSLRFLVLSGAGVTAWFLSRHSSSHRNAHETLMFVVVVAMLLACISALQQRFGGIEATRAYVLDQYGGDWANVPPVLAGKLSSNRVYGPFINPNILTGFLFCAFACATLPGLNRLEGMGKGRIRPPVMFGLLAFVVFLTLVFAESKAGWMALFVGAAWVALWIVPPEKRLWVPALAVIAAILGLAGVWFFGEALLQKAGRTLDARMGYWMGAFLLMKQNPLGGVGPGAFSIAYPRVLQPGDEESQTAHNFWMQSAADSGVPGLITAVLLTLVVFLGIVLFLKSVKEKKTVWTGGVWGAALACTGLGAWWLHNLADFHWFVPGDAFIALWMTGWIMAVVPWPEWARWRIPARWAWSLATGFTAAGLLISISLGISEAHFRSGVALFSSSPYACEQQLDKAIRHGWGNAEAYRLRARLRVGLGRPDLARMDYLQMLSLVPTRAAYHAEMGAFLQQYGSDLGLGLDEAMAHLEEAVRLYPNKSEYNARLGEALLSEGRKESAEQYLERAKMLKELEP